MSSSALVYKSLLLQLANLTVLNKALLCLSILFINIQMLSAQSSWIGGTNTDWKTASNWTAGVPDPTTDAIIGDANFTGGYQPKLNGSTAKCLNLTVGNGAIASTLTIAKNIVIYGDILIGANGTIDASYSSRSMTIKGNWTNNGTYSATASTARVTFSGTNQTLTGSTTFKKLKINSSATVTLASNIACNTELKVYGTLDPTASYAVSGTGNLKIRSEGILLVMTANFTDNYPISGTVALHRYSYVDYASTSITQNISSSFSYGRLRISGGSTKELTANLPNLKSSNSNSGRIYIDAGTLDLKTYTANRGASSTGGYFVIASGAKLKIGGTNGFPSNYSYVSINSTSTVEYYGNNQTVVDLDYGNLTFSATTGNVVKTMPGTSLIIYGDFTTSVGTGTGLSFSAGANIDARKNVIIGVSTTFNAGSYTHYFRGDWTNNGTYNGSTSSSYLNGINSTLSGTGINSFYHLYIYAAIVTCEGTTDINISGNLYTSAGGTFTHNAGGTLTMSGVNKIIHGNGFNLHNLIISNATTTNYSIKISGDLTCNGSLTCNDGAIYLNGTAKSIIGAGSIYFNRLNINGTISTSSDFSINGNLFVSNSGSFTATGGTASCDGSTSLTGNINFYDLTINAGKTLGLGTNSTVRVANTFTKNGSLDVTSSTPNYFEYNSTGNQTVTTADYYNLIMANGGIKTLAGNTTVRNNITINSGVTLDASSVTLTIYKNWNNNGTFAPSTSDVVFTSSAISNVSGATTFNNFTINKSSSSTYTYLKDDITASNIIMTNGILDTEIDTITTTGGRTGSGIIYGTIKHSHAFTGGTDYYFEGPNNSINFTSPSAGLTSVSMTISPEEVTDFDPSIESIEREYEIRIPNGTYTDATIRFHYEDVELSAFEEPFLAFYKHNTGMIWDSIGFTSRNIALNWVEHTALTSVPGRYTCSGLRSVLEWNGSVGPEWEDPDNWTTISGTDMSSRIPTTLDAAKIGTSSFTFQPTISDDESIAALRFGSVQAVTLTLDNNLSTVSSAKGFWSSNQTHTIDVGSNLLDIGSNVHLSDGTAGNIININVGTGSINVENNLFQKANSAITFTGSGGLTISGNYKYIAGTFTPATSTVTYSGPISQIVAPVTYYNLAFTKTNERASINSATIVNGNLVTNIGGEVEINDTLTVAGNITIGTFTTLMEVNADIYLNGNWTTNGTFSPSTGAVYFNGTSAQSVNQTTFNDVIVNKSSGTLTLADSISINNDLTVTNGIVDLDVFKANRSNNGGAFTLGAGTTLKVGGADNFPKYYATNTINVTSTIEFDGTIAQSVLEAINYGNLTLSNGGVNVKSILGNIQIDGNLLINSGATLSADSVNISIYGNLTNNGTIIPGESTLILEGSGKTLTGPLTLNNLTANGSYSVISGTTTLSGNLYIETTGDLNFGSNDAILDGDLTNAGILTSNANATFTGTRVQTIQLINAITSSSTGVINLNGTVSPVLNSTSSPSFATININNTGGVTASTSWNVFVACNIGAGASFDDGGFTHNFYGNFTNNGDVVSSGNLKFMPGAPYSASATITLDGSSFTSSGDITFGGTALLTVIDNAPTFHNVIISNTFGSGVTAPSSWDIGNELQILAGATFNAGTGLTHTITGGLLDNGTLVGQTSTIIFDGDSVQINGVGSTTFNNLTIPNGTELTTNKDFNISQNLVNNGSFVGYGRKISFTGTAPSTISGTAGSITISDFEQNKTGSTTTLSIPVTITDGLYLTEGIVISDATNLLILNDDVTSTPGTATSFVDGAMKKIGDDAFVFPLGNSSKWARLGISAPALTTDAFTAQYFDTDYADTVTMAVSPTPVLNNVATGEYWTCDRTVGSSNVTVQLFWEDANSSGINSYTTDLVVARWNGSAWENAGQSAIDGSNPGSLTSNTVSSFSPFTFGSLSVGLNPLPIQLVDFTAQLVNNIVELDWETVIEINNYFFTIERSVDGFIFEELETIEGAGNSVSNVLYATIDNLPLRGVSYYRLKQTNFDGQYSYSHVAVISNNSSPIEISVYPNPSTGIFSINGAGLNSDIIITNAIGKVVFKSKSNLGETEIDLSTLLRGIYTVQVCSANKCVSKKIILSN